MALAKGLPMIEKISKEYAVVLLPMCNPSGYARNWRYLDRPDFVDGNNGKSTGDSNHLLIGPRGGMPYRKKPSSPEAGSLTEYVLDTAKIYPPDIALNLHEDDEWKYPYVFSEGPQGINDPVAKKALYSILNHNKRLIEKGERMMKKKLKKNIIGPSSDGSIDQLLASEFIMRERDGVRIPGPAARVVIVAETPSKYDTLKERVNQHYWLIRDLLY